MGHTPTGSSLYDDPPHSVDIYLPSTPGRDTGGGVKLVFPDTPSQADVPCIINTSGASTVPRQGQETITVGNRVSFLTSVLKINLTQGSKLIATDSGRTFIIKGIQGPNRSFGDAVEAIPAFTYVDVDEIL